MEVLMLLAICAAIALLAPRKIDYLTRKYFEV